MRVESGANGRSDAQEEGKKGKLVRESVGRLGCCPAVVVRKESQGIRMKYFWLQRFCITRSLSFPLSACPRPFRHTEVLTTHSNWRGRVACAPRPPPTATAATFTPVLYLVRQYGVLTEYQSSVSSSFLIACHPKTWGFQSSRH